VTPYTAVVYTTTTRVIQSRQDMRDNIRRAVDEVVGIVGQPDFRGMATDGFPVRLIALPEAFCTAWPDCFGDLPHAQVRNLYDTTIPGPETELLGEAAKATGAYVMACMQAADPELMEDRFFNTSFILDPHGEVIYKRHKASMFHRERLTCPTDIWDRYLERYGDDPKALMEALYPVARTDIGNLATTICGEGDKPEPFRALALHGAELICRATYPFVDQFELQNRAHAHFNTCYVIGPEGPRTVKPGGEGTSQFYRHVGHIIDYQGTILARNRELFFASATIDIEQLRRYRLASLWQNWLPQLRIEDYAVPYLYALEIGGLYPRNLAMDGPPLAQRPHDDVIRYCLNRAVELGIYTPPDGWTPFSIPEETLARIEAARSRSRPWPA
jgi:predicted amidohydrolase